MPVDRPAAPMGRKSESGEWESDAGGASPCADGWAEFVDVFRSSDRPLAGPWAELFAPIRRGTVDDLMVVGQIGQSLDGRTATVSGHSRYVNGPAGLAHLHRLRALVDAVVVGVGTVVADDPQLTVRRVAGPQPARVVIDPKGRSSLRAKVFAADGARRLLITARAPRRPPPDGVEVIDLPLSDGRFAPPAVLGALAARGLRRVLVEGGAETLSRFLAARCLDRLHVIVAPVILGSGRASLVLPQIETADQALRIPTSVHRIGSDILFDCDLSLHRAPIGQARKST